MNITPCNIKSHATFSLDSDTEQLILALHDIGSIMFGTFTFKSGIISPIYVDLRKIMSHPQVLHEVEQQLWNQIKHCSFDVICPVPMAAIPLASSIAFNRIKPLILARPFVKDHGTKRAIEGIYNDGDIAIVIEDVITSGQSILEVIDNLENNNLKVHDIFTLLNYQSSGNEKLAQRGYHLHALFTISQVVTVLEHAGRITDEQAADVRYFIEQPKQCCS